MPTQFDPTSAEGTIVLEDKYHDRRVNKNTISYEAPQTIMPLSQPLPFAKTEKNLREDWARLKPEDKDRLQELYKFNFFHQFCGVDLARLSDVDRGKILNNAFYEFDDLLDLLQEYREVVGAVSEEDFQKGFYARLRWIIGGNTFTKKERQNYVDPFATFWGEEICPELLRRAQVEELAKQKELASSTLLLKLKRDYFYHFLSELSQFSEVTSPSEKSGSGESKISKHFLDGQKQKYINMLAPILRKANHASRRKLKKELLATYRCDLVVKITFPDPKAELKDLKNPTFIRYRVKDFKIEKYDEAKPMEKGVFYLLNRNNKVYYKTLGSSELIEIPLNPVGVEDKKEAPPVNVDLDDLITNPGKRSSLLPFFQKEGYPFYDELFLVDPKKGHFLHLSDEEKIADKPRLLTEFDQIAHTPEDASALKPLHTETMEALSRLLPNKLSLSAIDPPNAKLEGEIDKKMDTLAIQQKRDKAILRAYHKAAAAKDLEQGAQFMQVGEYRDSPYAIFEKGLFPAGYTEERYELIRFGETWSEVNAKHVFYIPLKKIEEEIKQDCDQKDLHSFDYPNKLRANQMLCFLLGVSDEELTFKDTFTPAEVLQLLKDFRGLFYVEDMWEASPFPDKVNSIEREFLWGFAEYLKNIALVKTGSLELFAKNYSYIKTKIKEELDKEEKSIRGPEIYRIEKQIKEKLLGKDTEIYKYADKQGWSAKETPQKLQSQIEERIKLYSYNLVIAEESSKKFLPRKLNIANDVMRKLFQGELLSISPSEDEKIIPSPSTAPLPLKKIEEPKTSTFDLCIRWLRSAWNNLWRKNNSSRQPLLKDETKIEIPSSPSLLRTRSSSTEILSSHSLDSGPQATTSISYSSLSTSREENGNLSCCSRFWACLWGKKDDTTRNGKTVGEAVSPLAKTDPYRKLR